MKKIIATIILCNILISKNTIAQGCSDAGFCTMGSIKQNSSVDDEKYKQKLAIILTNGIGDEDVYVFTPAVQYDYKFNNKWAVQAKLTANYASGNLGSAFGIGDLFLAGSYSTKPKNNWRTIFTLGTKIPLNESNLKADNKSLPMQYQSSLGTVDIIGGFTVTNNKWNFSAAYQQPLSGTNKNKFLPIYWNTANASKYLPSNDFNRKSDALIRVSYLFNATKKININAGLLAIYHFSNDTYIDGNVSNNAIEIKGSNGLTLNATAIANYKINNKISLGLTVGVPLVVRDFRPDGLTRQFVISPEIIFNF